VNRRAAAVRAFFEHQVLSGGRDDNPVPAPRRGQGLRPKARGVLGHLGPGRARQGGRLVRQLRCLPESLEPADVSAFLADLDTHRDRAIVLLMVFGGLRAAEVRSLRLADVDQGRRRVRVVGKGGRERTVPVDGAFFSEVAAYLRLERPPGVKTAECFVVLHGPTAGQAMTEAGMRSVFRYHRVTSGAARVRPHRLRHTYGSELAAAGIDLLVLRELMGHASPETTAGYVHLSTEHVAAEYAAARAVIGR
jgi:site-specific recombinase XerD